MQKKWNIENESIEGLSVVESILYNRGITDKEEIEEFLSNKPKKTYDPFLMKNMNEAIERIIFHINNNSKIVIFGDYDVDGVTASTLLMEFFSNITNNIDYYIPNRFSEGYGMNKEALKSIKEELGGDLVITVDTGISSFDEVEYAKQIGLEVIVTDHHTPPKILPDCVVVDVKQEGDTYPFKDICGCGVAFKLAQALQRKLNISKGKLSEVLDLVALATIADIVPLVDENRTFIKYGLRKINSNKRVGLAALREVVGLKDKEITSGRIGFIIAPCFNAAGRIDDARQGVRLLLEKDLRLAKSYAEKIVELNKVRQSIQQEGFERCKDEVEEKYLHGDFLVIRADEVSEGVIGIIAGKIKDLYYRPTLIVTKAEDGYLKGSGRSIKGIDIYKELESVKDLLEGFGGHKMACGFSIDENNLGELRGKLDQRAKQLKDKSPELFIRQIDIESKLDPKKINLDLIDEIAKLEPYGMGNPKPIFAIEDVNINQGYTRSCGQNNTHLKFLGKKDKIFINGIGFLMADEYEKLGKPKMADIAFSLAVNEYNGKSNAQVIIEDIKI